MGHTANDQPESRGDKMPPRVDDSALLSRSDPPAAPDMSTPPPLLESRTRYFFNVLQRGPEASSLSAVVRLRWIALAGQIGTVLAVVAIWSAPLPMAPIAGLFAALAISNAIAGRLKLAHPEHAVGTLLLLDVALLTGLLALTGGPTNPFTVLLLIHVVLAAIITSKRWTWSIIVASSLGFGLLYVIHVPLPAELGGHHGHHGHGASGSYSIHLQGMWLAYTISAVAIGGFVSGVAAALRRERQRQEQTSRLLGLAALAAGAAHEIGNPLGTIRIAAGELEQDLASEDNAAQVLADVRLINQEVSRATAVLDRLATAAGELTGEAVVPLHPGKLVEELVQHVGTDGSQVQLTIDDNLPQVRWPKQATAQALTQFVRNALAASEPDVPVQVRVNADKAGVAIKIRDEGLGMAPDVLKRVGEPFFTTRPEGGMGLGVFVARALIERMGGQATFESSSGKGTTVFIWLPSGVSE